MPVVSINTLKTYFAVGKIPTAKHFTDLVDTLDSIDSNIMLKSIFDVNNNGIIDRSEIADSVQWENIAEKPLTFDPSSHNHDLVYYQISEIDDILENYANINHDHNTNYYLKTEIDLNFTPINHIGSGGDSHSLVSELFAGFMSPEDKMKLDDLEPGGTTYIHPDTHPALMITEDVDHNFVTLLEKTLINSSEQTVNKNIANGYVGLDENTKIENTYLYPPDEIIFDIPTTDLTAFGQKIRLNVFENSIGFGSLLHIDSTGLIQCNSSDSSKIPCHFLAVEIGVGLKIVLMNGIVRNDLWNWTPGDPLYVSDTNGIMTQTIPNVPSENIQIIGYAITPTVIFFKPDYTFLTL